MTYTDGTRPNRFYWPTVALLGALVASTPVLAQKKTGPDITGDDALTWHGITLYGVIDVGLQYDTHGAPFTDYRPAASANIVQKNSRQSVFGVTPSNMGSSRVGLQGLEPLNDEWSAVFRVETFFNPQSGELADALKSLTTNNGKTTANSGTNLDGSSAGQIFQTAFAGFTSKTYGTFTFGRQLSLLTEGTVKYDPNYDASAFGLIGASGTYQGGGTTEDKRLDSTFKYYAAIDDLVHVAALYKFNNSNGAANTVVQGDVGFEYAGASIDAYYSKENDGIAASALTAAQLTGLTKLGYSDSNSVSAVVSDNTTFSIMALYKIDPLKFFLGFENIKFANPHSPLSAGYADIGGYILAYVNNTAYTQEKILNVYWTGIRYTVIPNLDLTAAYYGYHQSAYGTGKVAGCTTNANAACSGNFEAFSFDADYFFNKHFDVYAGAMYSAVHDGLANGYTYNTTNINPTIGLRYKF
jgi:predicted porin